jgi:hypothetical protein
LIKYQFSTEDYIITNFARYNLHTVVTRQNYCHLHNTTIYELVFRHYKSRPYCVQLQVHKVIGMGSKHVLCVWWISWVKDKDLSEVFSRN